MLKEIFYLCQGYKKKLMYVRVVHYLIMNYRIFIKDIRQVVGEMMRSAVRAAVVEKKEYVIN